MLCSTGYIRLFLATFLMAVGALSAFPQSNKGTISPVESDDEAPPKPVLHYYDKHGERLDTPVLFLAELDTASTIRPKSPYPLFNGVTVGVNFADAVMSAIGQKHSSYDISAMVSLHNWFFPVVEAGIGWGHHTDNNNIFKVKAYPSMYAKVGINYNFLYKSDPDYMAYLGLRFGVANCRWDKTYTPPATSDEEEKPGAGEEDPDAQPTGLFGRFRSGDEGASGDTSSDENVKPEQLPDELNQRCTSIYGELVAGLKVKIVGPFSLGWTVRCRIGLHHSGGMLPWFVPGYGTGPIGFTFNAYLTFGQKKKKEPELPME